MSDTTTRFPVDNPPSSSNDGAPTTTPSPAPEKLQYDEVMEDKVLAMFRRRRERREGLQPQPPQEPQNPKP